MFKMRKDSSNVLNILIMQGIITTTAISKNSQYSLINTVFPLISTGLQISIAL